ncbi:2-acylglycerol O-acyltransferase 2-A [Strongylocentrotus purpuratus]|uniref:Acyltransferase n=1 Tax=Strongylocentrotus purpuratus TaxID=7668 RepID=A0A7M7SX11_STRPU|nr:2-acylglycerol O-acyltransferase 2-A [Strongylocentrotus purpuratus]
MADSETIPEESSGRTDGKEKDTKNNSGSNVSEAHSEETSQHHQQEHHEGVRKVMGLELAPLRIPLHRRLETLAVFQWWLCFMFQGLLSILVSFYLLFFTSYYWIPLLLIAWIYYDRHTPLRGGRPSNWMRRWRVWVHMRNYFPINLIKTADLDPKNNYLMGFHPHGVMSMGSFVNFGTEACGFSEKFPGMRSTLLTLGGWFYFPLARDYILSSGMCDCSRESIDYLLGENGKGNAVVLVVGGAIESLEAHPHANKLYLNRRRGFIIKAMEHGAHLVPVYSFGETDIYEQIANPEGSFLRRFQGMLTKLFGFAPPLYHGRGIFNYSVGFMPYRKNINTIVGEPIPVEKNPNPTSDEIQALHNKYKDALISLFEDNKAKYGVEADRRLSII